MNSRVFCQTRVHSRRTKLLGRTPTRPNEVRRASSRVLGLCDMVHPWKVQSHIDRVLIASPLLSHDQHLGDLS